MRCASSNQRLRIARPWPCVCGVLLVGILIACGRDAGAQEPATPVTVVVLRPVSRSAQARLMSAVHARLRTSLENKTDLTVVEQARVDALWQRKWNRSVALDDLVALGREVWADQVVVSRVRRTQSRYEAYFATVGVDEEGILVEERVEAVSEEELLHRVRRVADRIYAGRDELFSYPDKFLFLSMFVPGKAEWQYGSKIKGGFFFASIAGLFAASALLSGGDPYFGVGELSIRSKMSVADLHYYIGEREVGKEEFQAEARYRRLAQESRSRARRRKRLLRYTALGIYAINIVDAFLLGRDYQRKRLAGWALRVHTVGPPGAPPARLTLALALQKRF